MVGSGFNDKMQCHRQICRVQCTTLPRTLYTCREYIHKRPSTHILLLAKTQSSVFSYVVVVVVGWRVRDVRVRVLWDPLGVCVWVCLLLTSLWPIVTSPGPMARASGQAQQYTHRRLPHPSLPTIRLGPTRTNCTSHVDCKRHV